MVGCRVAFRPSVLGVAMLFVIPGFLGIPAGADTGEKDPGIRLYLEAGTFDPLREGAPVPDDLRSPDAGLYRIVQFTGPVREQWKQAVAETGAVLFGYLPDHAFIVRMDPALERAVKLLPFVRWTGAYHPGYKLHPALAQERGEMLLNVMFFDDPEGLELQLRALGLRVLERDWLGIRILADVAFARSIAFLPEVQWIDPIYPPDILNDNGALILKVRQSPDGNFTGNGQSLWSYNNSQFEGIATGRGVTVCVQDTGIDGNHVDLSSKKVAYIAYLGGGQWTDPVAHGTHVAGTVLGTGEGQGGKYAGMAPGARLIGIQGISMSGIATEAQNGASIRWAQDNGADIVTNSWGESSLHGTYGSMAISYDRAVRDCNSSSPGNQSMIIIFAAGNEAFSGIREPATAKNVITIGATGNNRPLAPDQIASFSSNGPTNDGRRKPDVMAPGAQVTSCRAATANQYTTHDGTSMAAPGAAGAAALVVQYYRDNYDLTPSPALMKALFANGAEPMSPSYTYPGMGQGFGRINVPRTVLSNESYQVLSEDQKVSLATGEQMMYNATVMSQDSPLKVMLAWTDPPGTAAADRKLVNDLDLELTSPSGLTYWGNNFTNGESRPGGNPDDLNNLEGFFIRRPEPGTWTIKVSATNVPSGPQDYAIVFSGDIDVSLDFVDVRVEEGPAASVQDIIEGETVSFTASVRNNGTLPVNGSLLCRFSINGQTIENITLPGLEANTTTEISTEWVASRGKYLLKVEVDPANLVREKNESNNARQVALDVLYHGLVLVVTSSDVEVDPGSSANFFLSIKNAGTANDTFSVNRTGAAPPEGWSENLTATTVPINRSSSFEMYYTLVPPAGADAGVNHTTRVTVTSLGNSTYTQTVNLTARARQVFGMNFTTDRPADFKVENGERVEVNFTLVNPGNGKDGYTISYVTVGKSPGWPVELSMSEFTLGARERMNLTMFIDIPAKAFANDSVTLNVTARSSHTPPQSYRFRAMVRQSYVTRLTVDSPTDQMAAGADLTYRITARNDGNGNDTVFFGVKAPTGWNATLARQAVALPARSEQTFDLVVSNPPSTLAGTYTVNITSSGSGGNVVSRIFNVTIIQWYRVEVQAAPPNLTVMQGGTAGFSVAVRNLGNGDDTFEMVTLNLPGGWSAVYTCGTFDLGPDETAHLELFLTTLNTTPAENYTFTVKAVSQGKASVFHFVLLKLELLELPKPPPPPPPPPPPDDPITGGGEFPWLLAFIVLAVIIAAVAGGAGYAVHRSRKRDAWQPTGEREAGPPAEAQPVEALPVGESRPPGTYATPPYEPPQAYEAPPAYEPPRAYEPQPVYEPPATGPYTGEEPAPAPYRLEPSPADTGPRFERPDYQPEVAQLDDVMERIRRLSKK
ncbi:MAG: hypothetical protein FJ149_07710 [Euryarchaeota archaeon]|nr:hypothetical protein [Euryarchaeota archaeon]